LLAGKFPEEMKNGRAAQQLMDDSGGEVGGGEWAKSWKEKISG